MIFRAEGTMKKTKYVATGLMFSLFLLSCKTADTGSQSEDGTLKQRLSSQSELDKLISKMGGNARQDLRYVKFYKAGGLMHAALTEDEAGLVVEKELGLVSWAPATVAEARETFRQYSNFGPMYLVDSIAKRTGKLAIFNFIQIRGNFALHSTYAGANRSPDRKNPNLLANGKLDPSGHGCVRIQDGDGRFGGIQYLYSKAQSLTNTYGQPIPLVVDYRPFLNPDKVPDNSKGSKAITTAPAPKPAPSPASSPKKIPGDPIDGTYDFEPAIAPKDDKTNYDQFMQ